MARQETGAPTTKVMSGTIGASVAALIVALLQNMEVMIPSGLEVAITTVLTFIFGYYTPPASGDKVVH
jgi:hypothetical protein